MTPSNLYLVDCSAFAQSLSPIYSVCLCQVSDFWLSGSENSLRQLRLFLLILLGLGSIIRLVLPGGRVNICQDCKTIRINKIPLKLWKERLLTKTPFHRTQFERYLIYHVPTSLQQVKWSYIFSVMEEIKEDYFIEDYTISQTTLEEVFFALAGNQLMKKGKRNFWWSYKRRIYVQLSKELLIK